MNTQNPVGASAPPNFPAQKMENTPAQPGIVPPPFGQPGAGMGMPGPSPLLSQKAPKEPFHATRADAMFGIWCLLALGGGYLEWLLPLHGWGVLLYTGFYAGSIVLYGRVKGVKPAAESWFWLGLLLATALSFALWPTPSIWGWQIILLFFLALYWCGGYLGIWGEKKTGNWFLLDLFNFGLMVPFRNFGLLWRSTVGYAKEKSAEKRKDKCPENGQVEGENAAENPGAGRKNWGAVVLGLGLGILFLAMVLPLLFRVDGGNFTALVGWLGDFFDAIFSEHFLRYFWELFLGLPVALYLCGLAAGGAHKRYAAGPDKKRAAQNLAALRVVPQNTLLTLLGVALLVYLLFIGCQIPHYFSAFMGRRPPGLEVYSEIARAGFAELCQIVGINLVLLAGVAALGKKRVYSSKALRALMAGLLLCTLFFVAVGLSKMALYIGAYGLSAARLKTMVFMAYLALLCLGAVVLLWRRFSIARLGLTAGCTLLCLLSLAGPEGVSAQYNAWRFEQGSLKQFDTEIMQGGGYWAAEAGLRVYSKADRETQDRIEQELSWMLERASWNQEGSTQTLSDKWMLENKEIVKKANFNTIK